MRVFFSEIHELHAPATYVADGMVRACPDSPARVGAIREALVRGEHRMVEVGTVEVDPWAAIRAVHNAGYLEYLRTIHGVWWAEFHCDVVPDTFPRRGGKRPAKPAAQAGFYCFDVAAPITAGTWEAVVAGARCAVGAAEVVRRGERAAYALCRPPGHHAGADYCGGFCYLNSAAVAAQHLILQGVRRVAIVDVDYHHGNGTQDIFWRRRDVLFVSVHADPDTQFPYFWGFRDEVGEGDGEGFTVNLPLARGTGEGEWLEAVEEGLGRVRAYGAEALVVSLGVDTVEGDTVGDFAVTEAGFKEVGRRVAQVGVPTVFVQEGGYAVEKVGECVAAVLGGFERS